MDRPVTAGELRIVPANEASWSDLQSIFGDAAYPHYCQCQRFKVTGWLLRDTVTPSTRAVWSHTSTMNPSGGSPSSRSIAYPKLRGSRVPWTGRDEDKDDPGVWSITP